MTARRVQWAARVVILVLLVGGVVYLLRPSAAQPQPRTSVLPVAADGDRTARFLDCSKVNSLAYFANNPCETFLLIGASGSESVTELLRSQDAALLAAGWRHPILRPAADYDDTYSLKAPLAQSWFAPHSRACAYVTTVRSGIAAEGKRFLPFDYGDDPKGLLTFYRKAQAVQHRPVLWVRLRPPEMTEPGACAAPTPQHR